MNLFKKKRSSTWSAEQSIFNRAFTVAGLGFLLITVIGLIVYYAFAATSFGQQVINAGVGDIYGTIGGQGGMSLMSKLSIASMVLIGLTSILQFIWWFRIRTAGKVFIYFTWIGYIIGQGIGFGFLFLTFDASELFLIFGLAGGLFASMAIAGYYAKNLSGMGRYLFAGSMFAMLFGIVLTILSLTGVLNLGDKFGVGNWLFDIMFFFSGLILLGYIAYTVWRLKRLSQYAEVYGMDESMRFRYIAFFGFRLMSDMVSLVWTIARFVARATR